MKNVKRSIAVILSIFFVIALVLSLDFTAENREHECVGENCPVCAVLKISDENSRSYRALRRGGRDLRYD